MISLISIKCKYTVKCKNSSISNNSVSHKFTVFCLYTKDQSPFQIIQFSMSTKLNGSKYWNHLNDQTTLFQTIQYSIIIQFKCETSIWPIDRTLSGATTLGQNEPGSDGNKGVLRISQSSSITGASPSDCLVSYPGHSLGESYLFAEMQLVYSRLPANMTRYGEISLLFHYSRVCRDTENSSRFLKSQQIL